ncbi:hypothetical protein BYT27DRAFT_7250340 [Phlegmacium glaucopus]|nr:hypothetical protein BYT27DRAFT_7250340 [Phlegmacium glaucopus]
MSQPMNDRQHRKDCKYTAEERKVMGPYKESFRTQTTKAGHLQILRTDILPAIFNYWVNNGNTPKDDNDSRLCVKELTTWLSNNWRPQHMLARNKPTSKIKKSEVIWKIQQDLVLAEIANMLGLEEANTTTPGWFAKRLPAIANMLERMTPEGMAALDADVERINRLGYPEDIKRKLGEKYTIKRLQTTASNQWKELGALSITFTAYMGQDGKIVIDVHDHIVKLMSVTARSFVDTYKNEVTQMKRLLLEYIKTLRTLGNPMMPLPPGTSNEALQKITINMMNDGFPALPLPGLWINTVNKI